jgi:hypothetical protein
MLPANSGQVYEQICVSDVEKKSQIRAKNGILHVNGTYALHVDMQSAKFKLWPKQKRLYGLLSPK